MVKWDDFVNRKKAQASQQKWAMTTVECPKCGCALHKNLEIVLTTYPPKSQYKCFNCGFVGVA